MKCMNLCIQIQKIFNNCYVCFWPILIHGNTAAAHFLLVAIYPTKRKIVIINSLDYARQNTDVAKVNSNVKLYFLAFDCYLQMIISLMQVLLKVVNRLQLDRGDFETENKNWTTFTQPCPKQKGSKWQFQNYHQCSTF